MVGIKVGERGLYLRTSLEERLRQVGPGVRADLAAWVDRELWTSVFEARVQGTTGAGDATAAGFLLGLLLGMSLEVTITGCVVGVFSVEASDATSGIQSSDRVWECLAQGWRRCETQPGEGCRETGQQGICVGPRERRGEERRGVLTCRR